MNKLEKGDKIVFVSKDNINCIGKLFTFENYYENSKKEYLWTRELIFPLKSSYFRLATLLEIELQSEQEKGEHHGYVSKSTNLFT